MLARPILAAALIIFAPASAFAQAAPVKPSTVTAAMPTPSDRARQWLTLVDDGNYSQSWNEAGAALKGHDSAANWAKQEGAVRAPLGAVASRDLKAIDLSRSNVAEVRYDTSFAHKTGTVETVTLAFEKGAWSVTDYSVK